MRQAHAAIKPLGLPCNLSRVGDNTERKQPEQISTDRTTLCGYLQLSKSECEPPLSLTLRLSL